MDYISILLLIIGIANIFFLFLIFIGRSENKYFGVFSLYITSTLFWIAFMYLYRMYTVTGDTSFTKYLYISATLIPSSFLYFTYVFPFKKFYTQWKGTLIILINSILAYVTYHTNYIIEGVRKVEGLEPEIVFGKYYWMYVIYIFSFFMFGFWNLYRKYKLTDDPTLKKQTFILLGGYIIAANIAFVTNLFLPYLGIFNFNWVGQICTGFVVGFLTYTVFRHKLFQVKALTAELLVSILWIFLLTRTLLSRSTDDIIYNSLIFVFSVLIGMYLIRNILFVIDAELQSKKVSEQLVKKNIELHRISEEKSEFVSLASHQIRGPLTSIKGYISLLREGDLGPVSSEAKEALGVMETSCTTLAAVVNDYLDVSRIEQGKMHYDFTNVDMRLLLRECMTELSPSFTRSNLLCIDKIPAAGEDEVFNVRADRTKLKQVVMNIIDNSIKYTPAGSITVSLIKKDDGMVRVEVKDTGVGIPAEVMPKLFVKFSRAPDASEANILGTGLGLFIAKAFVEAHEGHLWAESEGVGKGSTFVIELKGM